MQQEAADLSITLVKNTLDQLPIRPETHKNIRLYIIEGEKMVFTNQMTLSNIT